MLRLLITWLVKVDCVEDRVLYLSVQVVCIELFVMAKPIEPTPVLENKDAKAFWDSFQNIKFDAKKELELEKSRAIYKLFSKNK